MIPIPAPDDESVYNKVFRIDGVEYTGIQTVQYYPSNAKRSISVPAWYYSTFSRLYQQRVSETKSDKTGEFVNAVRDKVNNILAVSYVTVDLKVLSAITPGTLQPELPPANASVERQYINRSHLGLYIQTQHGAVMYCEPMPNAGNKDLIIRDIYRFGSLVQVNKSLSALQDVPEDQRSAVARILISSLTHLLTQTGRQGRGEYKVCVDYLHHAQTFEHDLCIYDPNTCTYIGTAPPTQLTAQDTRDHTACLDLHASLQCAHGVKAIGVLRVKLNAAQAKDYYYKSLGRVFHIVSTLTDRQEQEVMDGVATGKELTDYVELYVNTPSIVRKVGEGWLDDTSDDYDDMILTHRVSLQTAGELFGLYETATLADMHGDPDRVETARLKSVNLKLTNDTTELERQMQAMKLEQIQLSGQMTQAEHDLKMKALRDEHARELEAAVLKHAQTSKEHAMTMQRDEVKHVTTMQTESRRSDGEFFKFAAVMFGAAATIGLALVKIWPSPASVVLAGVSAGPVAAGMIGSALCAAKDTVCDYVSSAWNYLFG
jgi:hypothetical protein